MSANILDLQVITEKALWSCLKHGGGEEENTIGT